MGHRILPQDNFLLLCDRFEESGEGVTESLQSVGRLGGGKMIRQHGKTACNPLEVGGVNL